MLSLRSLLLSLLPLASLLRLWSWPLNLRFSLVLWSWWLNLLLSLLLMLLNLRPLLILLLPLLSEFLSLGLRSRLIALDAPSSLPFPMTVSMPALPVLLKSLGRNPFIVPPVPVPITVSVESSPTWVYIKIETWNIGIINPAPVVIP